MKKIKKTIAAAIFCAAAFAGYTTYESAIITDQERMMLANLEALTDDEVVTIPCKTDDYLQCQFEIVNAEGSGGIMTIEKHIKSN